MKALVTAGSALAEFDTVRRAQCIAVERGSNANSDSEMPLLTQDLYYWSMSNIFDGGMGVLIANELAALGHDTMLLLMEKPGPYLPAIAEGVRVKRFSTFGDLEHMLAAELQGSELHIVFMAAAPPDYAPVKIAGKKRSDDDTLTIHCRKTPKLIDRIRPAVGERCCIVGFKLLVGATDQEMEHAACTQIARAHTDFCVGNDLTKISYTAGTHGMRIFSADGARLDLDGKKDEVVKTLVEHILGQNPGYAGV